MINRDDVLNRWVRGESPAQIAAAVGTFHNQTVVSIVSEARQLGDKRAVKRPRGRAREELAAQIRSVRHRRALAHLPHDPIQMFEAIRLYTGPITKLPPAVHCGHRPKCLAVLGY